MSEYLTLKWGTLKAWDLDENGPAFAAFERFVDEGMALGAMQQRNSDTQVRAICDIIDALDNDTVYLDWDGRDVNKDEAKKYVLEYHQERQS